MKLKLKVSKTLLVESMSEFIGTFILVSALFLSGSLLGGNEPLLIAMLYVILIITFSNFSKGHLNPLFTIADFFKKVIPALKDRKVVIAELKTLGIYLLSQLLGALCAYFVVLRLQSAIVDYQILNAGMELTQANKDQVLARISYVNVYNVSSWKLVFFLETMFSFMIALVYLASYYSEKTKAYLSWAVGLSFFATGVFVSTMSGGTFHFIKSLVAAMFAGGEAWSSVWVFVVGGILGALMAALVYVAFEKLSQVTKK